MNSFTKLTLKVLQKAYIMYAYPVSLARHWGILTDLENSNNMICLLLLKDTPFLIARFGCFELDIVLNYLAIQKKREVS